MAGRDYKQGSNGRARNGRAPGSWVSFVSGLGLGLVVAFGLYLSDGGLRDGGREPPPSAAEPAGRAATPPPEAAAPPSGLPAPKFDFYKILPEIEVTVPESGTAPPPSEAAPPEAPAVDTAPAAPPAYVLQVGSFQRFEDADQAKAELALQGVQATIQRVVINGEDVWHRVHVGPFSAVGEAQAMRARLLQIGMQPIVLKIGGG